MSLQAEDRLFATCLGITRHQQPLPGLPANLNLPGGVHVRWSAGRAAGFPSHGFLVFRREHTVRIEPSGVLSNVAGALSVAHPDKLLPLENGVLWSNEPLALIHEIPSSALNGLYSPHHAELPELPLSDRDSLIFEPRNPRTPGIPLVHRLKVWIGFLSDGASVDVSIRLGTRVIERRAVWGDAGQVVMEVFAHDAISAVEFSRGPAVVAEIEFVSVDPAGWSLHNVLPPGAIRLPCDHPGDPVSDWPLARRRIHYGDPDSSQPAFEQLHRGLSLLSGVPSSQMQDVEAPATGEVGGPAELRALRVLDALRLSAIDPAVAQMLGLYLIDSSAAARTSYDYMVVACRAEVTPALLARFDALHDLPPLVEPHNFDAWICSDVLIRGDQGVEPPAPPRAYALPRAGLDAVALSLARPEPGAVQPALQPGVPLVFQVWRRTLGAQEPAGAPPAVDLAPAALPPIIPGKLAPTAAPEGWPPAPIDAIDASITAEGWYSYRVAGRDVFGRYSPLSEPAEWTQWTPPPDPPPWYFEAPFTDRAVHPFAVAVLDKRPPPPPNGVEAFLLDPADPLLVQDAAYLAWRAALPPENQNRCGLRVRWRWPVAHRLQAPDATEFRIYLRRGRFNHLSGRIVSVQPQSPELSLVTTDIPSSQPVDRYVGTTLLTGLETFDIMASGAAGPLQLLVRNRGHDHTIRPRAGVACGVAIPGRAPPPNEAGSPIANHPLFVDPSQRLEWDERLWVEPFVGVVRPEEQEYEVFLPRPDQANDDLLPEPSETELILTAQIGISTADRRAHTSDDAKWATGNWGNRTGNEGALAGPREVFRVRRTPPEPPEAPLDDSPRVFATAAAYDSKSAFTFRWIHRPGVRVHVCRASDESIFAAAHKLQAHGAAPPASAFPAGWEAQRKQQVMDELAPLSSMANRGAALAAYRALSNDALRVLASRPDVSRAYAQLTVEPLDPASAHADRIGPDTPESYSPQDALRAYVDWSLDGRSVNRYFYRAVFVDGAHNRSALGPSTPPVYLPNVTPPRAPVITRTTGGDRRITVAWASNREADLLEYRVFRTDRKDTADDIRRMAQVGVVAADPDPSVRPATIEWVDQSVPSLKDHFYRVVAVDRPDPNNPRGGGGNVSKPSAVAAARAYDQTPPNAPLFTDAVWVLVDAAGGVHDWAAAQPRGELWIAAVRLTWEPGPSGARLLVEWKPGSETSFRAASGWLAPGTQSFLHAMSHTFEGHTYRLKVLSAAGNVNAVYRPVVIAANP